MYGRRMDTFCKVLKHSLPVDFSLEQPMGGYFVWIRGPTEKFNTDQFFRQISEVKILNGLKASSANDDKWKSSFRVSIAYYDQQTLEKAANLLCESINQFLEK